jgi:hypothetical protein
MSALRIRSSSAWFFAASICCIFYISAATAWIVLASPRRRFLTRSFFLCSPHAGKAVTVHDAVAMDEQFE